MSVRSQWRWDRRARGLTRYVRTRPERYRRRVAMTRSWYSTRLDKDLYRFSLLYFLSDTSQSNRHRHPPRIHGPCQLTSGKAVITIGLPCSTNSAWEDTTLKKLEVFGLGVFLLVSLASGGAAGTTVTLAFGIAVFDTPGTHSFSVPSDVKLIRVIGCGGGGGGAHGGGGAGAEIVREILNVSEVKELEIVVGTGGYSRSGRGPDRRSPDGTDSVIRGNGKEVLRAEGALGANESGGGKKKGNGTNGGNPLQAGKNSPFAIGGSYSGPNSGGGGGASLGKGGDGSYGNGEPGLSCSGGGGSRSKPRGGKGGDGVIEIYW